MSSTYHLDENNSYKLTFNLVDGTTGNSIALQQLGTLLCTQYYYNQELTDGDANHLATINNRFNQNVLNTNNFTVGTTGNVTWLVQPEDTEKLDDGAEELHIALLTWLYSGKQNSHEFHFYIKQVEYA